ncbi:hypothetical protein SAMN05443270_4388 [Lacrimispora sphenoides]|jgi:predicted  nucleic acid-binding Zn-ribbon protein|uniref:hypothetical protein n=1 Tax=Lacrimispora sphenoides TaxID=29370 RepID=UPI0008AABE0E|nr:hypothetical protein [Lacrimispora sphenoides]SEU27677.1 hypothetical protein SAMN05443270_4388 [Lacrimispora sphenoides]
MELDKNVLKQYLSIKKEIEAEEIRIDKLQREIDSMIPTEREVTDVVTKGKRGKKPLGICIIRGNGDYQDINKKRTELRERRAKKELHVVDLEKRVIDVETYIYSLEESELRNILLFSCIDGMIWKDVAAAMGEGYTEEACKQKFSRFMRVK